jgi:hypothetical protein
MSKFNTQKNWWIVVIVVTAVGIATKLITDQWTPNAEAIGDFLSLGLIGAVFCWAYSINRERLWWAIIPGLGVFTLLAALLADYFIGTDPENDWISVLVIGIGAAIIGAVLKRKDAKLVLYVVAMFAFFVGILMAPSTTILKIILIVVDILIVGFFVWRNRNTPVKSS